MRDNDEVKPKDGEWWMCEVYHHQVPYMQVLYRDEYKWLPKVNVNLTQGGMLATIKPKHFVYK